MKRLSDVGENALVRRLRRMLPAVTLRVLAKGCSPLRRWVSFNATRSELVM